MTCRNFEEYKPKTSLILQSMLGMLDCLGGVQSDPRGVEQAMDIFCYNRLHNIQTYGPTEDDVQWLSQEAKHMETFVKDKFGKEIAKIRKQHNLEDPSAKPSGIVLAGGTYNKREDSTDDTSIERQALDTSTV